METWARNHTQFMIEPIAKAIAKFGISPNAITAMSAILNLVAGTFIAFGEPIFGGCLMAFIAMPLDVLDGAVARVLGRSTAFGAFFDSVLDRFSEAAILIGIAALLIQRQEFINVLVCDLALLGSLMVSYTRARAEGLGIECKVGWFPRLGRVIVLATGLILDVLDIAIWILAIASLFTALQRIVRVYQVTHADP